MFIPDVKLNFLTLWSMETILEPILVVIEGTARSRLLQRGKLNITSVFHCSSGDYFNVSF